MGLTILGALTLWFLLMMTLCCFASGARIMLEREKEMSKKKKQKTFCFHVIKVFVNAN